MQKITVYVALGGVLLVAILLLSIEVANRDTLGPGAKTDRGPQTPASSAEGRSGNANTDGKSIGKTRGELRRALARLSLDGDLGAVTSKLEATLETTSTADLVTLVKDTNFREDGTPILHLLAAEFGRRSNREAVETLAKIYASCSSDDERARLGFLVREIRSPEGLDALQTLIVSPQAKQAPAFDPLMSSAGFALAASGDPLRAEVLLTTASQSPAGTRSSLFNGSLQIDSLETLPLILSIVDRTHPLAGDEDALRTSVYLLGQIRSEKSRDKLQQLVSSGDSTMAQWAKEAEDNLRGIAPGLYGSEEN